MKIEFDEQCPECKGTGIYVGMAEHNGYGVVCRHCEGTGKYHFVHNYENFEGLKQIDGVRIVLQSNPGICVGGDLDFGGMSYTNWYNGKQFEKGSEMRKFTCPAWWFQSTDYDKKPKWDECGWGMFSNCKHFADKDQCWARYDREFK